MSEIPVVPELKAIVGALIFGANRPLKVSEMRKCVVEVAEEYGNELAPFATIKDADVRAALEELDRDMERVRPGFVLREVAGGYRLESQTSCGIWLRHLLELGKPNRLSRPALETLAIIAYRQPLTKVSIEGIRGVQVDHIMKMLMEMQLVRIVGRSDLPGRPFLYGTTQKFLEHFGLGSLDELGDLEPMLMKEALAAEKEAESAVVAPEGESVTPEGEPATPEGEAVTPVEEPAAAETAAPEPQPELPQSEEPAKGEEDESGSAPKAD